MREFKYDVIQLLQCVRDRPCLWNKNIEYYKDRLERRNAWEEIFNILDDTYEEMPPEEKRITGELILNKWTNIRDTFMKSLKTKMGKYKRKYVFYDHLEFLTELLPEEERQRHKNPEPIMKQEPDSFTVAAELEPETSTTFTITNVTSYGENDEKTTKYDSNEPDYSRKSNRVKRKAPRLVYVDDIEENDVQYNKKKSRKSSMKDVSEGGSVNNSYADIDFVEVDNNDPRIMNEDEAFFASLLPTVVKYNEEERLEFRIEVLGVMKKLKEKRNWTTS
uniref:MADF domain-containing protein n=1 Tax=Heliothis virescens TaxID=7102 RepID=A0A2A4JF93_HELVI